MRSENVLLNVGHEEAAESATFETNLYCTWLEVLGEAKEPSTPVHHHHCLSPLASI